MKLKRLLKWSVGIILLALVAWVEVAYWTSTNDCGHTAAPNTPMKAIVYCDYGLANLKLENIEKPTPNDDQVLVKVRAASVNPYDWHFVEGTPKIMRMMGVGLRKPRDTQLALILQEQLKQSARTSRSLNLVTRCLAGEAARLPSMYVGAPRAQLH